MKQTIATILFSSIVMLTCAFFVYTIAQHHINFKTGLKSHIESMTKGH